MTNLFARSPYSPVTLIALVFVSVLATGALVSACDSGGSNGSRPTALIPLEVDNSWTFEAGGDATVTLSVSGTRTINDREYFEIRDHDGPRYFVDERGNGIFVRDNFDPHEFLIKYPVEDGEIYNYTDTKDVTYEVTVSEQTVETQAGTFEALRYEISGPDPELDVATFAPGVGLVQYKDGFDTGDLVSYSVE